jgi:hypothetical protein
MQAMSPDDFGLVSVESHTSGLLIAQVSIRLGPVRLAKDGLDLREREEFVVHIPPDFPFERPWITVQHRRFAGFPHVVWSRSICLYQSDVEWNPSDGMYGLFDRLRNWLGKAAVNDMDPLEGPLEPPHHTYDPSEPPFIIRSNAPAVAGSFWIGLAELERHPNRVDLVGWNDLSGAWPEGRIPALAICLAEGLPMEFPRLCTDFSTELSKQGVDKAEVLRYLAWAARLTPPGESIYLVLGLPMRRSSDGSARVHVAVWKTSPELGESLRLILERVTDTDELRQMRSEFAASVGKVWDLGVMSWCRVFEDRDEIVVRRDRATPLAQVRGKRVLILGCGALGSWTAEMVARALPAHIHLLDLESAIVKPGILARQNYVLDDLGMGKGPALARRLASILSSERVAVSVEDAHRFLLSRPDLSGEYDLIIDCTASHIFQMKLERDWACLDGKTPVVLSMIISANSQHCLGVVLSTGSRGGIWDAYVRLKYHLCLGSAHPEIISSFYGEQATKGLFQPEPGCSDPTFAGSTADVAGIASQSLNLALESLTESDVPQAFAFSTHTGERRRPVLEGVSLPENAAVRLKTYTVRIAPNVLREARACVRQNQRRRSASHETGGLLWGHWDDAIRTIWVLDASGPPPDSLHDPGHFVCGTEGTREESRRRAARSFHVCEFIGFWHTHPNMSPDQSVIDMAGMADLVSTFGQNQKRALMMIFGRVAGTPRAGLYVYESQFLGPSGDVIAVEDSEVVLTEAIV